MSAGNKTKEEIKATIKIIVANIPNSKLGLKLENNKTRKPMPSVILVPIMALPVVNIVVVVAFS